MLEAQSQVGYSDLLSMPDDGRRYEIHGGELVVVPAPRLRHQVAALEIFKRLDAYAATRGGRAVAAPFDIVFDEHDVVQPDVVFFRSERARLLDPDAVTRAAPDVAVEVLSPSTAKIDRGERCACSRATASRSAGSRTRSAGASKCTPSIPKRAPTAGR